ncbi:MAG: HesA/MoeB/ThiF family protein [Planctomycetota bacterium]
MPKPSFPRHRGREGIWLNWEGTTNSNDNQADMMTRNPDLERIEQDPELSRYSRQIFFDQLGEEGQRKLLEARVTLIGCGGLGSAMANLLARAGVGFLRIVDRDIIEPSNLHRQVLYDEDDISANLTKAQAARQKLQRINSGIQVETIKADVDKTNIEQLVEGADLLLDGTDNVQTRFLINDVAVKTNRPWIYGACIRATGMSMPILPHDTPCLRCPVVNMVASHQALEAIKILIGRLEVLNRNLVHFDAWTGKYSQRNMQKAYDEGDCPCCKKGIYEYLEG